MSDVSYEVTIKQVTKNKPMQNIGAYVTGAKYSEKTILSITVPYNPVADIVGAVMEVSNDN